MESHEFAAAFDLLNRMVPEKAIMATAPIFAADSVKEHLHPFGTGTLLSIAQRRFIITAAHVRSEQKKQGFSFLCAATKKGGFTPLVQSNWYLNDKLDVAVFDLTERNVTDFGSNTFLNLSDIDLNTDTNRGIFAVFGLPAKWSQASLSPNEPPVQAKALQFITNAYEGNTSHITGFDPSIHILLNASNEDHRSSDGTSAQWPDRLGNFLPGISGCGIWKLCDTFEASRTPDKLDSRLVAVETGVYSATGVIKGTRWDAVANLLRQAFPDLQSAFEIAWPPSRTL